MLLYRGETHLITKRYHYAAVGNISHSLSATFINPDISIYYSVKVSELEVDMIMNQAEICGRCPGQRQSSLLGKMRTMSWTELSTGENEDMDPPEERQTSDHCTVTSPPWSDPSVGRLTDGLLNTREE